MMTARRPDGAPVRLIDLRIGELLAEGGEGKVYQLPLQPHLVFKAYRRSVAASIVEDLVSWPRSCLDPEAIGRVYGSSAWPLAVVLDEQEVAGLLLPRAPKRFSLRHRDGATRLASLSYLTTDPTQRAAAYGLRLPAPGAVERFGLVYALARLLEVFDAASPRVGHGDLSTKNVLWSLQRGPEVFVIDCDNCDRFGPEGQSLGDEARRRAMTPNWDDPAVPSGGNPTIASDRYSLALIFLRIVGAANYPIQARQRSGDSVNVDFPLPPGLLSAPLLRRDALLWELCERGLSLTHPEDRPPASAWVGALEAVLDSLGGAEVMRSVWAAQGGGSPSASVVLGRSEAEDVVIRPVVAAARSSLRPRSSVAPARTASPPPSMPSTAGVAAGPQLGGSTPVAAFATAQPARLTPQMFTAFARAARWWVHTHRSTVRTVVAAGARRQRARALAFCAAVDAALAIALLFVVGMIVSPFLGI